MIADRRSPQQALAAALGGTILDHSTIRVGDHLVTTRLATVRCDGVRVGQWNDATDVLAARVGAVVAGAATNFGPVSGR